MSSSAAQIEVSGIRDVQTDDATLTVMLDDGRVISTPLEWYPRLAYGTPEERAEWELIGDGDGIHWPRLDEDISVEGLIAGSKSGECAASLKRWMVIQEKLRQMPIDFPELRREVLRTGPVSTAEIVRRARKTVEVYENDPGEWSVACTDTPFDLARRLGFKDESPLVIYEAESSAAAEQACHECAAFGFIFEIARDTALGAGVKYVMIYCTHCMK